MNATFSEEAVRVHERYHAALVERAAAQRNLEAAKQRLDRAENETEHARIGLALYTCPR